MTPERKAPTIEVREVREASRCWTCATRGIPAVAVASVAIGDRIGDRKDLCLPCLRSLADELSSFLTKCPTPGLEIALDYIAWDHAKARGEKPTLPRPPGPRREGSPRCRSGSIAAGGTREYCTCDVCF